MRSTDGQSIAQRYRVINNNKKLKVTHRAVAPSVHKMGNKRFTQTKLKQRNLLPESEDYQEDDMSQLSDMEFVTESEMEQTDNEKDALKTLTSTIRPLLQLFSDDSCSPRNADHNTTFQDAKQKTQQIVYKNINLSSEEDDEEEEDGDEVEDKSILQDEHNAFVIDEAPSIPEHKPIRPRLDSLSRFEWSPKSTNIFLDLWEKHLKDLRGPRKNAHIHKEMAEEMSEYGPSHKEIKSKMDNMSRKFRLEMQKVKAGNPTNWQYFKRVQSLLIGTPSVDFEEIIFDNTDSSTFFNADSSDEENHIHSNSHQDREPEQQPMPTDETEHADGEEVEEQDQADEKVGRPPSNLRRSDRDNYYHATRTDPTSRMLDIEEEKLAIEKQKLQVMKHISRELTSISKTLIELLRNAK
ncbi:PREDICTED: uncharacterized protein LOC108612621 [Drosophila arizonae]|uniref:Uncharacterized protein LOC108612621 n=1 Tax=Drosophila arizonae TaxID=7263 RepID=A0ABM1P1H4_DROAR|nr:PREDICTED: uncharacterized protein LOC108612621 [Drosophila arizonae]